MFSFYDYIQTAILTTQLFVTGWSQKNLVKSYNFDYIILPSHYNNVMQYNDTLPTYNSFNLLNEEYIDYNNVFIKANSLFNGFYCVASIISSFTLFVIIVWTILTIFSVINKQFNLTFFLKNFFTAIENEFNAPRVFLVIVSLLSSTLLLSAFLPFFNTNTPLITYVYISLIVYTLSIVLLWPISLIFNWGAYFTIYIKGESTMSNLIGQVVMDYFYVVSFFLRINLQFIRIIVLSGVFIIYNEFYFEFIYPNYNFNDISLNTNGWTDYTIIGLKLILTAILRFIYELGHMWGVLLMQANAFAIILFLILQSLHTVYLSQRLQYFFKNKRI